MGQGPRLDCRTGDHSGPTGRVPIPPCYSLEWVHRLVHALPRAYRSPGRCRVGSAAVCSQPQFPPLRRDPGDSAAR
eukprot:11575439-Alexandrium_andersonii.AAC.1